MYVLTCAFALALSKNVLPQHSFKWHSRFFLPSARGGERTRSLNLRWKKQTSKIDKSAVVYPVCRLWPLPSTKFAMVKLKINRSYISRSHDVAWLNSMCVIIYSMIIHVFIMAGSTELLPSRRVNSSILEMMKDSPSRRVFAPFFQLDVFINLLFQLLHVGLGDYNCVLDLHVCQRRTELHRTDSEGRNQEQWARIVGR